jgi:predicted AlkP superfamily pyrophosphatase or phosphodiesterase
MKKQKLVVISVDSLIYDDLEYLKNLPNFKFLFENFLKNEIFLRLKFY